MLVLAKQVLVLANQVRADCLYSLERHGGHLCLRRKCKQGAAGDRAVFCKLSTAIVQLQEQFARHPRKLLSSNPMIQRFAADLLLAPSHPYMHLLTRPILHVGFNSIQTDYFTGSRVDQRRG